MTAITETNHAGEYLGSVVDRQVSFEVATVASGENLVAGQVVEFNGSNKLIACTGSLNTAGDALVNDKVFILHDNVDATDGDVTNCVYLARGMATVKDDAITYPTESTAGGEKAATVAALKANYIVPR